MKTFNRKKFAIQLMGLFVSLTVVAFAYIFYFSVNAFTNIQVGIMKWKGATEHMQNGVQYFEKNMCDTPEKCQCVLLVHGLGDSILTWTKVFSLDSDAFSTPIHLYAFNMPGSMDSQLLEHKEDYNIRSISERMANIFLPKCSSWVVVGNSLGGWMAVDMALADQRVKGLLLLSPAGLKKDYSHITGFFMNPTPAEAKRFYHMTYANTLNLPDFIFQRLVTRLKSLPVKEELTQVTNDDYLDQKLSQLKIPVQYVWGEKDQVIPTTWAQDYQKLTPQSELEIVPHCGHIPQKECLPNMLLLWNKLLLKVPAEMKTN